MSFKILSVGNFPEVSINFFPTSVEETQQWLREMDDLFMKETCFVLVYPTFDPTVFEGVDEKVSQESRKDTVYG